MLRKRLFSVFKTHFPKYLSTAPSPKPEKDLPDIGNNRENEILQSPDYFEVHNLFTVKDLFQAKVHYGHKASSLHHNMKPFVFGTRLGHVIFDLDITAHHLRQALNVAAHIAYRDGIILFVSKNPRMTLLVERTALKCKEFAVTRDFTLGLFTDSTNKFQTFIRLPDLVIVLNTLEENGFQHQVVKEAAKMCIPTIGIVDSNCSPNLITYPVPGNDDSYSCFELYCHLFKEAILRGKNEREKDVKKNLKSVAEEQSVADEKGSGVENTTNVVSSEKNSSNVKDEVATK